jgi:hypothetical protein
MAELSPERIEHKHHRLLVKVRNAAVALANHGERHGDSVVVDAWVFDTLILRINRLMAFEEHYAES